MSIASRNVLVYLFTSFAWVAVSQGVKPSLAAFVVEDIQKSASWYQHLGFGVDTIMRFPESKLEICFLQLDDFKLELIQFDEQYFPKDLVPMVNSNVHGFIKVGFLVNDLDSIAATLHSKSVEIIVGPDELPPLTSGASWPNRYFLTKDPDGNFVQFFEQSFKEESSNSRDTALRPFLAMLSVENFERTVKWYAQFGFVEIERVGREGNQRALLCKEGFVLEIGSFEQDVPLKNLRIENRDFLIRMSKIGFRHTAYDSLKGMLRKGSFDIYHEADDAVAPYVILKDPEGNYIQFFRAQ